jgi:Flp pilus assembly protein TadG
MHGKRQAHERGAGIVEAAVVIPLLLLILASVVDLGRAYFTYIALIDAAREGARYGAGHPTESGIDGKICAASVAEAQGQLIFGTLSCPGSVTTAGNTYAPGSAVRVTVHVDDFPVILGGLLGRSTLPMSYSAAFRIRCAVGAAC